MKYCTQCGKPNPDEAAFCVNCGEPFRIRWTPQAGGPDEDVTVLLPQEPAEESAGGDATVLLGKAPAEAGNGEDATILLPQEPAEESAAVYTPPAQPFPEGDAQEASARHLFPGPVYIKEEQAQAGADIPAEGEYPAEEGESSSFQPPEEGQNQSTEKKRKKGKIITLICVLAVAVAGAAAGIFFVLQGRGSSLTPLQEALQLGEKYLEELDYENAVMAFTEAAEIDPKSTEAYMGLAQSYTGAQEYDQAEASYRQLLALDSSNAEGYRELAELYIRLEKLEEAKALLEEAVGATDDEDIEAFYEETNPKAPSFTLEEGSYDQRQEVGITADKDSHVIHYTIDGTEPTEESPIYQEPIILKNGRTTVKAVSVSSRGYVSEVASAGYTITVERKKVEFKDPAIENAVRNTLGLGYGDLYNEDVEQIRELSIVGYNVLQPGESALFDADSYTFQSGGWEQSSLGNVETLEDLRHMPFLRRLHIAFQEDLDISGVASAQRLEELSLIHVGLQNVTPISGLTNLKKLCVGWNEISDISGLSGLTSLTSLGVWNNRISDISAVQNMKGLAYLDFSANRVSDISAVSSLENLSNLWMYQNQVSDFSPLEQLMQLRVLMIRDNPIGDTASLQKVFPRLGRTDVDVIDRGGQTE